MVFFVVFFVFFTNRVRPNSFSWKHPGAWRCAVWHCNRAAPAGHLFTAVPVTARWGLSADHHGATTGVGATQNLFSSMWVRADLSLGNTSGRGGAPFDTATGRHRRDTSLRRCLSRPDGDCQRTTTALRPARGGATHQKPLRGLDRMVSQHSDTKKT